MLPCLTLSIIRYGSRVKWGNPGNGVTPSLHLGVVAIEKGAFGSPSTTVSNFTLIIYIYIYIYIYKVRFKLHSETAITKFLQWKLATIYKNNREI